MKRVIFVLAIIFAALGLGWAIKARLDERGVERSVPQRGPTPVEVAEVEHGLIEDRREFTGSFEATAEFIVAPKVGGRVEQIVVDLADVVERGQLVAELENDEFEQAVEQAKAELQVANATETEARSRLEIARRALDRAKGLRARGVSSEAELDAPEGDYLVRSAALEVAIARVARAAAELKSAKIRLGYTRVHATWTGGQDQRVVASRRVDAGETIAANTAMLSVVELDPINAVVYVTERDYTALRPGQTATLRTDAWAGRTFEGHVARVAPVFRESSRQARVEIAVDNANSDLRPGMFVTATTILGRAEKATIVPLAALVSRDGQTGVFVVNADATLAAWRPVTRGIRDGERIQVIGDGVTGRVITLGQQLLTDGTSISIPEPTR